MSFRKYAGRSHPNECPACQGAGQTRQSETVMVQGADGKLRTARDVDGRPKCGSGCLKCGGIGILSQPEILQ